MKDYLELLSSVGKLKKFQKNSILFYEVYSRIRIMHKRFLIKIFIFNTKISYYYTL